MRELGTLAVADAVCARAQRPARRARIAGALATLALGALLSACGGGTSQDAHEPAASFRMRVVQAHFPRLQAVSRPTKLVLEVQNTGLRTVPNVAVSIDSFYYSSNFPGLADNKKPIWVIEQGPGTIPHPPVESVEVSVPGSATTAYVNTWALGSLAPRQTHLFEWKLVPVKTGTYTVHYRFGAGLAGKAKAVPSEGSLKGVLVATVAGRPPKKHVNPETGKVAPGPYVPPATERPSPPTAAS